MNLFGLSISRTKSVPSNLSAPSSRGGWFPLIRESFSGAWQRNEELTVENILTYAAVFRCISLISSDVAKMRIMLVAESKDGVLEETFSAAFSPVLSDPNHFQTRQQFMEQWITSRLIHGNAYVLKKRDNRRVVTDLYVLDPQRVKVLVAPDSSVYYEINSDYLSGLSDAVTVPASEIIHDRMCAFYHSLVGLSPISACGLAALQGLRIQQNSRRLFANNSTPSGILSAPAVITAETAKRVKQFWDDQVSGANYGGIAVLGDGLKFEQMTMTAVDAQLIEQLKWTAGDVCTAFGVPAYMIGVGQPPAYNNIEALASAYYGQVIQAYVESVELLLKCGLDLPAPYLAKFDLNELLRMDSASRVTAAKESANGGGMTFNEVRKRYHGLGPVPGGDAVLSQQQNFDIAALAKRDAQADPFATTRAPELPPREEEADETPEDADKQIGLLLRKELELVAA